MLVCPKCGSNYLTIKQRVGFEEIVAHFTPRRKYKCMGCGTSFRPPDRRKTPRGGADGLAVGQGERSSPLTPSDSAPAAPHAPAEAEPTPNAATNAPFASPAPKDAAPLPGKMQPAPTAEVLTAPRTLPPRPAAKEPVPPLNRAEPAPAADALTVPSPPPPPPAAKEPAPPPAPKGPASPRKEADLLLARKAKAVRAFLTRPRR